MISLDYLAGMIDADGYIGCVYNKKQNWYNLRITITNTDLTLLLLIQKEYGGKIQFKDFNNKKHRNQFVLTWSGRNVLDLLDVLHNNLIIKKDQAVLALTFPMGVETDKIIQRNIYDGLMKLKKKTFDAPEMIKNVYEKRHKTYLEKKNKAKELIKDGFTQSEIASKIGVSQEMVSKYLKI